MNELGRRRDAVLSDEEAGRAGLREAREEPRVGLYGVPP